MDHFVSKAALGDDLEAGQGGIKIIVQNNTFQAESSASPQPIEGEATVIEE
jgi:hypothetical protein